MNMQFTFNVEVREARIGDNCEDINSLLKEIYELHHKVIPDMVDPYLMTPQRLKELEELLAKTVNNDTDKLFVAECNGRLVGMLYCFIRESPDITVFLPEKYVVIETLVVTKSYRRHGIGEALTNLAHQWAKSVGVDQILLAVWEHNKNAVGFWEKHGYVSTRRDMLKKLD